MGKRRPPMEFIKCDKKRKFILEKMTKTLKKMAHELATSHNVPVCVIINPDTNSDSVETFPENRDEVRAVTDRYLSIPMQNEDLQEDNKRMKLNNPGPNSEAAETFPENRDKVRAVTDRYLSIPMGERSNSKRNEDLQEDNKRMKLKKFDEYNREELVDLVRHLDYKIQCAAERLRYLKTQSLDASFSQNAEFHGENAVCETESSSCTSASGGLSSEK